ncbi:flagellar hook protein FlgE [Salinicola avicenniae]|uniref:flagellar hook protein FlgE n=1 Tax=Salinicola avicenniae TaxID=2916836 RepID=UPI00207392EC|nr:MULTISPECIES: flagellar hook protein FlgE [unclassified Salinicola]
MGFSQALSGVNAASQQLDVIGNNISNSQTSGFKSGSVQFADVFANSAVGLGTRVSGVLQDFSTGSLETTGRNLDIAISGDGFLRFQQEGQIGYSRNGQLTMTSDGYLENAQGARLMGYGLANANDVTSGVVVGGAPQVINVPAADMPASATGDSGEGVALQLNLDSGTAAYDAGDPTTYSSVTLYDTLGDSNGTNDPVDQTTLNYQYSTSFSVYDSQGLQHSATLYFQKGGDNQWTARTALDGVLSDQEFGAAFNENGALTQFSELDAAGDPVGIADITDPAYEWPNLEFVSNGDAGQLPDGVNTITAMFNLAGTTQYANDSTVKSVAQDGYASGSLAGISFTDDGRVVGNYTNERSVDLGQVALANFRNPEGLTPSGGNLFQATADSGNEILGIAGTGTLGSIQAETLEASNVDLTQELVNLIIAQRNYQANTNSIRTQSEVMDQIAQLR